MEAHEIFAKRLRALRESKGISIRRLASDLEVSHSSISLYESAQREPTVGICVKVANYFNVSVEYMLGLSDEQRR